MNNATKPRVTECEPTDLVLGLDLGIASVGWAILAPAQNPTEIKCAGVFCFEPPEEGRGTQRKSSRARHGAMKRLRRQTKRRAERMKQIRSLLSRSAVLEFEGSGALAKAARMCLAKETNEDGKGRQLTPWEIRRDGLNRKLSNHELAVALGHIAGHRAYKSNSKRASNHPPDDETTVPARGTEVEDKMDEEGKVLKALEANRKAFEKSLLRGIRTVGEWLSLQETQRNRKNDYKHSIQREWVEQEVALLFERQRKFGNDLATSELKEEFASIAFFLHPIATSTPKECTFEKSHKRAAKHSYSFELFRLLARLNNLRIVERNGSSRSLDASEIDKVVALFGLQAQITYKTIRGVLKIDKLAVFDRVGDESEDIVARSGKCAPGTRALREVITTQCGQSEWDRLIAERSTLDDIAKILAHNTDLQILARDLETLSISRELKTQIIQEADGGTLGSFRGTGHLSTFVLRKIEPHLRNGFDYYSALKKESYDASRDASSRKPIIDGDGPEAVRKWLSAIGSDKLCQLERAIDSQTASRAVRQTFKQILVLLSRYPGISRIHVEMSRDVGHGIKKRKEIEDDQRARERKRFKSSKQFEEHFNRAATDRELERWTLYQQQAGKCAFTGEQMKVDWVPDGHQELQIEHIIPLSKGGARGLNNLVLCLASANQNKGSRTPHQWIASGSGPKALAWEDFVTRAKSMFRSKDAKGKLSNLLAVNTGKIEASFKTRDLNDTRWIAKFVIAGLQKLSTQDQPITVQPVNAGLVGMLRHAWGLDAWKRDSNDKKKRRSDDRHHALDAAIVASINQSLVQRLTEAYQRAEDREEHFEARGFRPPWPEFRRNIVDFIYGEGACNIGPSKFESDAAKGVFIVREEERRARGPTHKQTTYSVRRHVDGTEIAYETISIQDLEKKHLPLLKDLQRNQRLVDRLTDWLDRDKPEDDPPTLPYRRSDGVLVEQQVRKIQIRREVPPVRFETGKSSKASTVKSGADNDGMARVDVFRVNFEEELAYWMVPVYRANILNPLPPNIAIVSGSKRELPPRAEFIMSLYKKSYVRILTDERDLVEGYYRGFDIDSARLEIWPQHTMEQSNRMRVSASKVAEISKVQINRLGNRFPITKEQRTWHGKVCT